MRPVLVSDVMTSSVVTFFEEQTLPLAEDVMRFKHLRHLPVIDELGHLVGLVTHRDLLRAQISPLTGLTASERRAREEDIPIRQIMTRDVWTVQPGTLASVAAQTMIDHGYGCMPVVDDARRLLGIVTACDYLQFAIKSLRIADPEYLRLAA